MLQRWTSERDVETIPPRVTRKKIRLAPPPRVAEVRPSRSGAPQRTVAAEGAKHPRHPLWWMTGVVFLMLAFATFAVFVLLPKWVERRSLSGAAVPQILEITEAVDESAENPTRAPESLPQVDSSRKSDGEAPDAETSLPESPVAVQPVAPSDPQTMANPEVSRESTQVDPPTRRDPRVDDFRQAMSLGLAALDRDEFEAAARAFERAVALAPESTEAADGLARAQQALRLVAIAEHRRRAGALELEERWREAEAEYQAALALDSTLRFAREGEVRAGRLAELSERLVYHISHPERLIDDRVLDEARDLLVEAEPMVVGLPGLEKQVRDLGQVVQIASTPIRIVLVSDNSTEVVVYRVGSLGRFERRELQLRPGTYTVVGRREGYRDVRRKLEVRSDGQHEPLHVRCEEKI